MKYPPKDNFKYNVFIVTETEEDEEILTAGCELNFLNVS